MTTFTLVNTLINLLVTHFNHSFCIDKVYKGRGSLMYKPKTKKEIRCPLEYGLEVFGGKWKSRIICILAQKEVLRYNELKEEMIDITDAVLAKALKELSQDNIIHRQQYDEMPVRVEYSLTNKGKSVIPILEQICLWSDNYLDEDAIEHNLCEGYFDDLK